MRVAVACGLDMLHDGHLDHLDQASDLGDELVIMIAPDSTYLAKGGFCVVPFESRMRMARILAAWIAMAKGIEVRVVEVIDTDGTCTRTLRQVRPDIFAKGGDRVPGNMPETEVHACEEMGCEVRYGVGQLLNSRKELFTKAARQWLGAQR